MGGGWGAVRHSGEAEGRPPSRARHRLVVASLIVLSFGTGALALGIGVLWAAYTSYVQEYVPIERKIAQQSVGLPRCTTAMERKADNCSAC